MGVHKSTRWFGLTTLFVIVAISYIDRINISVLITDGGFLDHMGIAPSDRARQGFLATVFLVGYGISSIVLTPFCAATFGVRKSLMAGLALWGVVTFASPFLNSYGLLLASRILLGVSEGPLFSLAGAYIKAHYENHENGKPNSFVNMGTGLGLAVGYPFVGYMLATYEWQMSFYVLGLLNIAIGIPLVLAFVRMPSSRTAPDSSLPSRGAASIVDVFRGAMTTRYLFLITLLTSAALAYLWGASNWLPAYLREARGFSLREMGWLASLPQYATVVAVLVGGVIIDSIDRQHVPLIFLVASTGVALSILLAINAQDRYTAAYALVAANFCWGLQSPAIPSTVQYCSRPEHIASAYGIVNGVGSLVAAFMPTLMGSVIGANAAGGRGGGFFAGFSLLIGTQVVVFVCGTVLWLRERATPPSHGMRSAAT